MSAASNDIKRVTLELGGKSACVIFDDVDGEFLVKTNLHILLFTIFLFL